MKVGIVGAGQLGRMLGLAAIPLGIECVFLERQAEAPARAVGRVLVGDLDDPGAVSRLASEVDVLTTEIENVAPEALSAATAHCAVHPAPAAVAAAQDRLLEKQLFAAHGVPTAPYVRIDSAADLTAIESIVGWPAVIKSRRLGYDGRGQRVVESLAQAQAAFADLGGVPAIAEGWIRFEREVSLICVRGRDGSSAYYPLCENTHHEGILARTVAPYGNAVLQQQAEAWAASLLGHFGYVGVLTIEFFVTDQGLVANEMAPRVHNSGHWTIEGAETSQFENHVRAVAGLPLGSAAARGHAMMLNLVGVMPDRPALLRCQGLHLHDYGKQPRPGRKLGHCTLVDANRDRLLARAGAVEALIAQANS
jgi:5-(carboxyamino)imidazole ribonucleotide synthase